MRFPPVCVDHLRHAYGKHKVYEDLSLSFDMGKIYMMIMVAIVPIIVVYLLLSKYIIAGITLGGVKE